MEKKFKVALIILLVAAVAFISVAVYSYMKPSTVEVEDTITHAGTWISAELIEKPTVYYKTVPEDVDKWTKACLENTGKWVHVRVPSKCWVWQYRADAYPVEYEGQYYKIHLIFAD